MAKYNSKKSNRYLAIIGILFLGMANVKIFAEGGRIIAQPFQAMKAPNTMTPLQSHATPEGPEIDSESDEIASGPGFPALLRLPQKGALTPSQTFQALMILGVAKSLYIGTKVKQAAKKAVVTGLYFGAHMAQAGIYSSVHPRKISFENPKSVAVIYSGSSVNTVSSAQSATPINFYTQK